MRPGLKRVFDYLAYAVSGLALVGGVTYGLQHLPQRRATAPVAASAAQAPEAADASDPAPAEASAPDQDSDQAAPADTRSATNQPPPSVADSGQTGQSDANGETAEQAAFARDQATYYALQRNCYEAADNNQNGEYPALQASACNRYAQFAYARGWNAGTLPAYGQATQQAPSATDSAVAAQPDFSDQSQAQFQAPPQVIILDQSFNGNRQGGGYRPRGQSSNSTQPPRQTGPNFPLPPLPQPPEAFQPHRSEPLHSGRSPPGQSR